MATQFRDGNAAPMRAAMVDSQLRTSDVIDPAVVAAMGRVARELYVPPALAGVAYVDRPLALGGGRMLNPPLVTGRLLVAARLRPGQRVLLVGSATGYTAALLADIGTDVVALEEDAALMAQARAVCTDAAVRWVAGPLTGGAPDAAPFDRIIVEGVFEQLPAALVDQLAEGGRLVGARRDGAVTRLVAGVRTGGTLALRPFVDMDAAPLPGFARPPQFQF